MNFAPIQVGRLILEPIRYFFATYAPDQYKYHPDAKQTKIDISMFHDAHKEELDFDMQILVDRGSVMVQKTGLSDNMASQTDFGTSEGLQERTNFLMYSGTAGILIRARNEGTVEVLAQRVAQIIQWSRPHICDTQGFKEFGLPMTISNPVPDKPNVESFQVQITVPYIIEDVWTSSNDGLKLRDFIMNIQKPS